MARIVILTGSELRHRFVRKALAVSDGIDVARSYCEGMTNSLLDMVDKKPVEESEFQRAHLEARARSEEEFFAEFDRLAPDRSHPVDIERGRINDDERADEIKALAPDLLVAYGCSLIKGRLLQAFVGRFLNVHLGLSPYYRGSGTNFWPLVNREPEFVGATFMHIDPGVDTGEIVHQIRARVLPGDSPHQIGNRLIADMVPVYAAVVQNFDRLGRMQQPPVPADERVYRSRDLTEAATQKLYDNFAGGLVATYLMEREARARAAPIVENPVVVEWLRRS
jgi:folate-dependent phosphoribosylglycinamide formyltransferase PurN